MTLEGTKRIVSQEEKYGKLYNAVKRYTDRPSRAGLEDLKKAVRLYSPAGTLISYRAPMYND